MCNPIGLLEFWSSVAHRLLGIDDLAERLFGNILIFAAAVGGDDDPDGFGLGAIGRIFEEFTSDGTALVLVLKQER